MQLLNMYTTPATMLTICSSTKRIGSVRTSYKLLSIRSTMLIQAVPGNQWGRYATSKNVKYFPASNGQHTNRNKIHYETARGCRLTEEWDTQMIKHRDKVHLVQVLVHTLNKLHVLVLSRLHIVAIHNLEDDGSGKSVLWSAQRIVREQCKRPPEVRYSSIWIVHNP